MTRSAGRRSRAASRSRHRLFWCGRPAASRGCPRRPAHRSCARCALAFDRNAAFLAGRRPPEADSRRTPRSEEQAVVCRRCGLRDTCSASSRARTGARSVWNLLDGRAGMHGYPHHPACACAARTTKDDPPRRAVLGRRHRSKSGSVPHPSLRQRERGARGLPRRSRAGPLLAIVRDRDRGR